MRLTYKAQDQHGKETGTVWYAITAGGSIFPKSDKEEQALKKLAAYEDAEEQGRLVILPCKVGDKFYRVIKETYGRPDRINEYICTGFYYASFDGQGLQIRAYEISDGISHDLKIDVLVSASQFGKDIFLTRQEATAALERRRQNNV